MVHLLLHIPEACKLVTSGLLYQWDGLLQTQFGAGGNLRFACFTSSGGDQYNAISTSYSEYSGGRGVFQYWNTFDFVRAICENSRSIPSTKTKGLDCESFNEPTPRT